VTTIAVIVPVLNRPERAAPVVESILAAARVPTEILFVTSTGDRKELSAVKATGQRYVTIAKAAGRQGDYARKINTGLHVLAGCDWIFTGADDLRFTDGWDDQALHAARRGEGVVGTVDGCNPRTRRAQHSTHSLVARWYAEEHGTVDDRGRIYHEGYWHNFVDDEMVSTAVARRSYAPSAARVEHLHPMRRDDERAPMDDTYRLGLVHFHEDRRTFRSRRPLWSRSRLALAKRAA
jgi:glycosyltransferase involved in cell wall biosynthesis